MTECFDNGQLRAYLEGERGGLVNADQRGSVEAHLAGCAACRAEVAELRRTRDLAVAHLSALAPSMVPDVNAALARARGELVRQKEITVSGGSKHDAPAGRRTAMQTITSFYSGPRRAKFSGLAAAMLILGLFSFPAMRAGADAFLQTFRAKSVVFVPVSAERLQQLGSAGADPMSMFVSKPEIVGGSNPVPVGSLAEAAQQVNFTPAQPSTFPYKPASAQVSVQGPLTLQAQVNVKNVRELLAAMNINDVTLPDTLGGSPITANVPAFISTEYTSLDYSLTLIQGSTPSVTLPGGVQMSQLGKAGLRLLGMQPEQADEMSRRIDWSNTLVVPFPVGLQDVLKVQVGDVEGLLVSAGPSNHRGVQASSALYWQNGSRFYVLVGSGDVSNDALLLAARSVR